MALNLDAFGRVRPYVYHLTSSMNVPKIHREGTLLSVALLTGGSGHLLRKRGESQMIEHNGARVHIRDQAPLHAGNVRFEDGWGLANLLCALNERVFFWPGNDLGPIKYGVSHFLKYRRELPVILRMHFADLIEANPTCPPQFCRVNAGSPRCSGGERSLRGASTFLDAQEVDFPPSKVVEVTFLNQVLLPSHIESASSLGGPWTVL